VLTLLIAAVLLFVQPQADAVFDRFWAASTVPEAEAAAKAVAASGVSFDDATGRLKRGRTYSAAVPRGVVRLIRKTADADFPFTVDVPASYDPARRYQVRIHLHGGVMRPEPAARADGSIGSLAGSEQIYVLPAAWRDEPWWSETQILNLKAILETVKRIYNVDENRVVVSGVSDGGTGAYYVAMRDTTPYASFLPLNGFLMILAQGSTGIAEPLFPNNLLNKPFFIVNGGRDRLYPTSIVEPYVLHLQRAGVPVTYLPQPEGEHNTAWWPDVRDPFEAFVHDHPRDPHPAKLTWQVPAPGRAHWLVIDALAPPAAGATLPDVNDYAAGEAMNFGVRSSGMRISSVVAGSNAESFGLLPGDLVERINGRVLPAGVNLLDILSIYSSGDRLTLVVSREGGTKELSGVFQPVLMPNVVPLFATTRPSGRVDVVREGNTFRAATRGVAAFTLLVSPDVVDFGRPVIVVADGRTVFSGRVEASVPTLLKWAAIDGDRTMLYGAEVAVRLAP
jgi:hypothetical protein